MSTCVLFFGGYKATHTDMKVWLGSARAQKPDLLFDAFAWPRGAGADASSAVTTFTKAGHYKSAISSLESSGADLIYIVGHSSGCAIANAVDRGLKDHANVVLVALDGFGPDRKQLARSSTQVWAAECDGVTSRNYKALKGAVGGRLKVYTASSCKTSWALHFSLVNAAANDSAVQSIATGYAQCRANLVWL
jgi:basic membrane lipoprotein Med (substrate-binding protein (PBP1-ABC) superfamily)